MKFFASLLLAFVLSSCGGGKNPAVLRGKERFDYLFHNGKYIFSLKAGMTKTEVKAIIGPPENSDDEYIWLYTDTDVQNSSDETWMGLLQKTQGIYYVFYNEKLILPDGVHWYRTIEGPPEDTMQYETHLKKEAVIKLLNDARAKHLPK